MQSLANKLSTFADNVADAINDFIDDKPTTISRAEVIALEESERSRRIDQAASERVAELNAAKVSGLIKSTSFPVFKGNATRGYKRITLGLEESERKRRLTNKSESTLRKGNAAKSAGIIKSLGWPFYQSSLNKQGATYIFPDITEKEREFRMGDAWAQLQAKNNAALVSNIIRMEFYRNKSNFGTKRWTRNLEEKERSLRLNDKQALGIAARNAFNTSKIIRNLGWPFFVQETEKVDPTLALEEKERERRLYDKEGQQLARENAGKIFSTLTLNDVGSVEDLEKSRRLNDFGEQQHAKELARLVSGLVSKSWSNNLESQRAAGAHRIAKMIDGLFVPLKTIKLMEEQERKRRLNDIEGQTFARLNAKKVSGLVGAGFGPKALNSLEEEERTRRMWDRQLQMVALSNARKVSGLILANKTHSRSSLANKKAASLALEEKERNRRMIDRSYQQLAKSHNQKISGMIFDKSLRLRGAPADFVSIPVEPLAATAPIAVPVLSHAPLAASPALASISPISTAPAPVFNTASITKVVPSMPIATRAAPIAAAPIAAAPISVAPIASPLAAAPIIATPLTPTYATHSFPASGLQLHNLTDTQRKKLEKEASKHNKRAEKESKKASHDLAKAEKMHNKGKDGKAFKLETRAEQHTVAAKHHQLWAQDLAKDATFPAASAPAYRPAM